MSDRLRYIWLRCGQFNEKGSAETGPSTTEQFDLAVGRSVGLFLYPFPDLSWPGATDEVSGTGALTPHIQNLPSNSPSDSYPHGSTSARDGLIPSNWACWRGDQHISEPPGGSRPRRRRLQMTAAEGFGLSPAFLGICPQRRAHIAAPELLKVSTSESETVVLNAFRCDGRGQVFTRYR